MKQYRASRFQRQRVTFETLIIYIYIYWKLCESSRGLHVCDHMGLEKHLIKVTKLIEKGPL